MDEVLAWVHDNLGPGVDVRRLGRGESYEAWLVDASPPLVVRVAVRPPEELPRPIAAQLAALPLVPPGIGPQAIAAAGPLVVTTYVPGREVAIDDWTDDLLVTHARQLAVLHAAPFARCGDVLVPEARRAITFSLVGKYEAGLAWWRVNRPGVFDDDEVRALEPRVAAYVAAAEPEFARLDRFALVHGDLVVTNIVVDAGIPRYIDWEWAEIGDPAQDLALLGGSIAAPPWYLPLGAARLALFLDAYGADDSLRARRDAYEVFERFFSSLYYRMTPRHTVAARLVTDGLFARVG